MGSNRRRRVDIILDVEDGTLDALMYLRERVAEAERCTAEAKEAFRSARMKYQCERDFLRFRRRKLMARLMAVIGESDPGRLTMSGSHAQTQNAVVVGAEEGGDGNRGVDEETENVGEVDAPFIIGFDEVVEE